MIRTCCLYFLLLNLTITQAADTPLVAAASNMTQVLTEITANYRQETNKAVKLSFGSSGNFASQILQGAPFNIFISADQSHVDILKANGIHIDASDDFVRGRISIFIPSDSLLFNSKDLEKIIKSLIHGRYRRIAMANPEHAPYGVAAKQALQNAGLWVIEREKLLLGESAAQAMQFILTGGADLGIIPASYAYLPGIKNRGRFYLIPETWHQPIQQYLVLLDGENDSTRQFYNYLLSAKSRRILKNYGYTF